MIGSHGEENRMLVGLTNRRALIAALGSAAAWPIVARARKSMPVIGFVSSRSGADSESVLAAFRGGLSETGFVDGRNYQMKFRWADGNFDRLPALAADLAGRQVALIAAVAGDTRGPGSESRHIDNSDFVRKRERSGQSRTCCQPQ